LGGEPVGGATARLKGAKEKVRGDRGALECRRRSKKYKGGGGIAEAGGKRMTWGEV